MGRHADSGFGRRYLLPHQRDIHLARLVTVLGRLLACFFFEQHHAQLPVSGRHERGRRDRCGGPDRTVPMASGSRLPARSPPPASRRSCPARGGQIVALEYQADVAHGGVRPLRSGADLRGDGNPRIRRIGSACLCEVVAGYAADCCAGLGRNGPAYIRGPGRPWVGGSPCGATAPTSS